METNPKISVIIPIYNVEKYLRECLDTLTSQIMQDIEILCIDDCSTDSSNAIVAEYASKDARFSLIRLPENHGQAYARNQGVLRAKGKYIYFMDADDMLAGEISLFVMYKEAEAKNVDALLFDADIIFETKELEKTSRLYHLTMWEKYPDIYEGRELFSKFIQNNDFHCAVWQQLWRKEFLTENNLLFHPDTSPHEDLLFSFKAMTLAKKIRHIPEKLYVYRCRENSSMTGNFSEKRFKAYLVCYKEATAFVKEYSFSDDFAKPFAVYLLNIKRELSNGYHTLFQNGTDAAEFTFDNAEYRFFLETWLREITPNSGYRMTLTDYGRIKKFKHIIVYGAGKIGREILELLEHFGIDNYTVAVTHKNAEKQFIYGKEIFQLSDLKEMASDGVVVLAVGKIYQEEMKQNLLQLGFNEYIDIFK